MKRLIAVGRKYSEFHTQYVTFASRDPEWHPTPDPNADARDFDSESKAIRESGDEAGAPQGFVDLFEGKARFGRS